MLLYSGYDKLRDPSPKRQAKEIKAALKMHRAWKKRSKD